MTYLFEDGDDSTLLNFLRNGYTDGKILKGLGGVGLLSKYIEQYGKDDEQFFVFMDLVPDNRVTLDEYNKLVKLKENGYKLIVFPVPCTEYFFIKAFANTSILSNTDEAQHCINRDPITKVAINGEFARNYEKFCKAILHKLVLDCAKLDDKSPKFWLYYKNDCRCSDPYTYCINERILDKVKKVLAEYPCIPQGSLYETTKISFDDCIRIHRKLIDDYNSAVDKYIIANPELMDQYRFAKYMY